MSPYPCGHLLDRPAAEKLSGTIDDLAGASTIQVAHVAEAVQYRRALNRC